MVRSSILTMTDEESAPSEDAVDRASATTEHVAALSMSGQPRSCREAQPAAGAMLSTRRLRSSPTAYAVRWQDRRAGGVAHR